MVESTLNIAKAPLKVCILAAGIGSRNSYSKEIVKGLLPFENRPLFYHLLKCIPTDSAMVIAIGHHGELVKEFFKISFPDREFTFVEVSKYAGEGSGPGLSLLECAPFLEGPFLLLPSDAYIDETIGAFKENWVGVSPVEVGHQYCLVEQKNNQVIRFVDKPNDPPSTSLS